jgi:hypothetical protein
MTNIIVQKNRRGDFIKVPAIIKDNDKIKLQQNRREDFVKIPKTGNLPVPEVTLVSKIKSYISNSNFNYYLGFGGTGDALLLLATCSKDPKAKAIFFANNVNFTSKFFDLFNIPVFLHENIMGSKIANVIFDIVTKNPNFRQSAHLADGLFYGDWKNENKYIGRIHARMPWIKKFGMVESNQSILIIAPSGSAKEVRRQRYVTLNEYNQLLDHNLKLGYKIYSVGSVADLHYYGLPIKPNTYWLTAEKLYKWDSTTQDINLHQMLQYVNKASKVISVDTFLKTYSLICGIPTVIIKTRWRGKYADYGADVTDHIFLNKNIWSDLILDKFENLIL